MIWGFRPYSVEKNFADVLNAHCNLITDPNDWIVITDGDMMFLTHDWGTIIDRAIKEHGKEYSLLGCWVNRCNPKGGNIIFEHQYDNFNIIDHYHIAEHESLMECRVDEVHQIGGFFMAFQKSTFDRVGGFKQNNKLFDIDFCKSVREAGLKIGLINQLYVFHLYRPWSKNPAHDSKHLDK